MVNFSIANGSQNDIQDQFKHMTRRLNYSGKDNRFDCNATSEIGCFFIVSLPPTAMSCGHEPTSGKACIPHCVTTLLSAWRHKKTYNAVTLLGY